ncbi:MAG TPA: hypothetical protein VNU46_04080, partial [Gemmatimonadaceae bacterium]|nr:hypothetical protein [Gemmatimonadaceae bacterium]
MVRPEIPLHDTVTSGTVDVPLPAMAPLVAEVRDDLHGTDTTSSLIARVTVLLRALEASLSRFLPLCYDGTSDPPQLHRPRPGLGSPSASPCTAPSGCSFR